MKKRLFVIALFLTVLTSIITYVFSAFVYYNFYEADAKKQLQSIINIAYDEENWSDLEKIESTVEKILLNVDYDIRFTLIDKTGQVLYDSVAKGELENHKDRYEIREAFEKGFGESSRYSNTVSTDTYYYAIKIKDDNVLRISREINSIKSVLSENTQSLFILLIGLFVLDYIVTSMFTKRLFKPINRLVENLEDVFEGKEKLQIDTYYEFHAISTKIKEQKQKIDEYIKELKHEKDRIDVIINNMKEGLILLNKDKNVLSINNSGKQMIGNERFISMSGKNIIELTRNPEVLKQVELCFLENKHSAFDLKKDKKYYRYYLSPVIEQGRVTMEGLLILIEDVTEAKKAEIMRTEFSSNVSHELKTPLTTMIGFAEMMKEGLITDKESIKKYSTLIYNESMRLHSLIEDVMRLSKIEEGYDKDNESIININQIASEVVTLLSSKAKSMQVELMLSAEEIGIKFNKNYMNEMIYNLVDNAIKYNKRGGSVELRVYQQENILNISVKDTGIGIPLEHQDRIFERFYRVDKSRFKQTGGTGLGLSIVKHIAELYQGKIFINSSEETGTEIKVEIPLRK